MLNSATQTDAEFSRLLLEAANMRECPVSDVSMRIVLARRAYARMSSADLVQRNGCGSALRVSKLVVMAASNSLVER